MGASPSTVRCNRCWATYRDVSVWRFFGVGIMPDLVCCTDPMGERVTL